MVEFKNANSELKPNVLEILEWMINKDLISVRIDTDNGKAIIYVPYMESKIDWV
ncbi:hypothetical protein [Weissella fangxianensis]|uniref:hypothetical protein n=1 Tax=Weissella fangxianensis TaxID=2953879 RepID=UPI0021570155|nr:hypothetical protein [Weissella fangxianensis]